MVDALAMPQTNVVFQSRAIENQSGATADQSGVRFASGCVRLREVGRGGGSGTMNPGWAAYTSGGGSAQGGRVPLSTR